MKEVKACRLAGPFNSIPFNTYIQSPVGLVPKAGNQTRLIFHLSYNFQNHNQSLNSWTPQEICTVKYQDIDHAVNNCLSIMSAHPPAKALFLSKTDLKSAFRMLPIRKQDWNLLILKAENPVHRVHAVFFGQVPPIWGQYQLFSLSEAVQCTKAHSGRHNRLSVCCNQLPG